MESNFKSKTELNTTHFDIFNDKATKSKIYRHLIDINDTISEEDMRNIKVSFADLVTIPLKKNESNQSKIPLTPWDIMDADV
jgi:hypothetical protein